MSSYHRPSRFHPPTYLFASPALTLLNGPNTGRVAPNSLSWFLQAQVSVWMPTHIQGKFYREELCELRGASRRCA